MSNQMAPLLRAATGALITHSSPSSTFRTILTAATRLFSVHERLREWKLPQYIYYVPNLLNNAHNVMVAYDGNYPKNLWGEYFDDKVPIENTLVIARPRTHAILSVKTIEENWPLGGLGAKRNLR
ncbi:hypothetical protein V1522DRAFT_407698 [Lipomyces starkeyi]